MKVFNRTGDYSNSNKGTTVTEYPRYYPNSLFSISALELTKLLFQVWEVFWTKFPSKEEEWLKVAEGFNNMWQFENCLGAVDRRQTHSYQTAPRKWFILL
ncbi:unnamed protein product [Acanthoscelides obtectus]|uniref:Uncharacterized protein n=1 Tax=Acanthoscelides obtectus TaxID=200917 RepID=A0A9P0Q6R5_ACAOB|nr:unnamed protein product [Acanthoscelides obtectus]CAK1641245.1 hypothetical protein AOBTE_LOCUS12266 [Acanthoscelides obtectus]